ncbi:MAG: RNA polymerase sigma-70 factor [Cytophagales bacterium]|nr:RNA polymerase sigma-70 factor [Cytophagales bacterium]
MIDESSFVALFDSTHADLVKYAFFRIGDMEKAKDVVQEAFTTLWKKRKEFRFDSNRSLLYRLVSNLLIDQYRKDKVNQHVINDLPGKAFSEPASYSIEEKEFKQRLDLAIASLPAGSQEVFLLNRIEGFKYREIADILNISQKTVEKRMQLALSLLRKSIHYKI